MNPSTKSVAVMFEASAHRALLALLEREDMSAVLTVSVCKALNVLKAAG